MEWIYVLIALVILAAGANMALRPHAYGQGRRRLLVPVVVVRLIGAGVVLLGLLLLYEAVTLLT